VKISAFFLCLVLILTASGVMAQQGAAASVTAQQNTVPNQSWDLLRQLRSGERLLVERKTVNKRVSGEFISLSETDLVIKRKGKNERFGRDEVKNIWREAPPGLAKRVISGICVGAGILFGPGVAFGLLLKECDGSCVDEGTGFFAALIGIPVAAYLLADRVLSKGKRTLIYSAP
jgi:hypothetical protein